MSKPEKGERRTRTTGESTRFIGLKRFIDQATGETFDAQTVIKQASDAGFHKLWLGHILDLLDEVGNAKVKTLNWLLRQMDTENRILATYDEIAAGAKASRATVAVLMGKLVDANIISPMRRSQWRINPEILFRGSHGRRMNVLICYRDERQQLLPLDEPASNDEAAPVPELEERQAV